MMKKAKLVEWLSLLGALCAVACGSAEGIGGEADDLAEEGQEGDVGATSQALEVAGLSVLPGIGRSHSKRFDGYCETIFSDSVHRIESSCFLQRYDPRTELFVNLATASKNAVASSVKTSVVAACTTGTQHSVRVLARGRAMSSAGKWTGYEERATPTFA